MKDHEYILGAGNLTWQHEHFAHVVKTVFRTTEHFFLSFYLYCHCQSDITFESTGILETKDQYPQLTIWWHKLYIHRKTKLSVTAGHCTVQEGLSMVSCRESITQSKHVLYWKLFTLNRRSSEIQGTALGKCLQAWPVYTGPCLRV